jgi:hypothetical protein
VPARAQSNCFAEISFRQLPRLCSVICGQESRYFPNPLANSGIYQTRAETPSASNTPSPASLVPIDSCAFGVCKLAMTKLAGVFV